MSDDRITSTSSNVFLQTSGEKQLIFKSYHMDQEVPNIGENIPQPSHIKTMIAQVKIEHPDSVVIYFIKHKAASDSLPKPKKPLYLCHHLEFSLNDL